MTYIHTIIINMFLGILLQKPVLNGLLAMEGGYGGGTPNDQLMLIGSYSVAIFINIFLAKKRELNSLFQN